VILSFSLCLTSCSSLIHKAFKVQSDNRLRKTENKNFLNEKAPIQWWYFDFFLDDGSVLVLMFVPHHWWNDPVKGKVAKTLIYTSYLKADGELVRSEKIIDPEEVEYSENGIISSYLEIIKSHEKKEREYTVNFFLDEIKGSAKITSEVKAFSPLPTGGMGSFGTRHILRKGKGLAYRYAAHIPQGTAVVKLDLDDKQLVLSGKAYK